MFYFKRIFFIFIFFNRIFCYGNKIYSPISNPDSNNSFNNIKNHSRNPIPENIFENPNTPYIYNNNNNNYIYNNNNNNNLYLYSELNRLMRQILNNCYKNIWDYNEIEFQIQIFNFSYINDLHQNCLVLEVSMSQYFIYDNKKIGSDIHFFKIEYNFTTEITNCCINYFQNNDLLKVLLIPPIWLHNYLEQNIIIELTLNNFHITKNQYMFHFS